MLEALIWSRCLDHRPILVATRLATRRLAICWALLVRMDSPLLATRKASPRVAQRETIIPPKWRSQMDANIRGVHMTLPVTRGWYPRTRG